MNKPATEKKFNYIKGLTIYNAKALCSFAFGDFFVKIKKNFSDRTYDIYLHKGIPKERLQHFTDHWGDRFKFYTVNDVSIKINKRPKDLLATNKRRIDLPSNDRKELNTIIK